MSGDMISFSGQLGCFEAFKTALPGTTAASIGGDSGDVDASGTER